MIVNFILHSTKQPKLLRLSHFPISLPIFFMCCNCFPHFPACRMSRTRYEVAEHFETFRTNSTISSCSAVHLTRLKSRLLARLVGWNLFTGEEIIKKKSDGWALQKYLKYKRTQCWCLVFKGKFCTKEFYFPK